MAPYELEELRWLLHKAMYEAARASATCTGKTRFDTFALAATVAKTRARASGAARHAYHCPNCRGWHIGDVQMGRKIRIGLKAKKEQR